MNPKPVPATGSEPLNSLNVHAQVVDRLGHSIDRDGHGHAVVVSDRCSRIAATSTTTSTTPSAVPSSGA